MTTKNKQNLAIIPNERITEKIFFIRGKKVMFDDDLAELYGVETKTLNRAVKRNNERFPDEDFIFQLTKREFENFESLRYQIGTSKKGGRRYFPFVFTEQGVAMLSSVLNSKRAIQVNIQIIKTFTRLRKLVASNKELREKIETLEKKYDSRFKVVFDTLRQLIKEEKKPKHKIGFAKK